MIFCFHRDTEGCSILWKNSVQQDNYDLRHKNVAKSPGGFMTRTRIAIAVATLAVTLASGNVFAQDHHDDHGGYVRHNEWKKGYHMKQEDWGRGQQVDYHAHHLQAPPRGYEWRQVDGNYVMAAVATGVIASVIAASAAH
jgi:Ni/Co efflux regulator RcnB